MQEEGLEPPRVFTHNTLNVARLPVSPLLRMRYAASNEAEFYHIAVKSRK